MVFAPEQVIPATLEMHKRYGDYIYSSYGFLDSFNPSFNYDIPIKTGRLVPDRGWVASDHIAIDQADPDHDRQLPQRLRLGSDEEESVHPQGPERAGFSGGWLAPEGSFQPLELQKDERPRQHARWVSPNHRAAAAQEQKNNANRTTGQGK